MRGHATSGFVNGGGRGWGWMEFQDILFLHIYIVMSLIATSDLLALSQHIAAKQMYQGLGSCQSISDEGLGEEGDEDNEPGDLYDQHKEGDVDGIGVDEVSNL